jgi:hypothetical protein
MLRSAGLFDATGWKNTLTESYGSDSRRFDCGLESGNGNISAKDPQPAKIVLGYDLSQT